MRVISVRALRQFWESDPRGLESEAALRAWNAEAQRADWAEPADIKAQYRGANILTANRAIFNIAGNKFRLVVRISYPYRVVYIRFIGTNEEYDRIDAATI